MNGKVRLSSRDSYTHCGQILADVKDSSLWLHPPIQNFEIGGNMYGISERLIGVRLKPGNIRYFESLGYPVLVVWVRESGEPWKAWLSTWGDPIFRWKTLITKADLISFRRTGQLV